MSIQVGDVINWSGGRHPVVRIQGDRYWRDDGLHEVWLSRDTVEQLNPELFSKEVAASVVCIEVGTKIYWGEGVWSPVTKIGKNYNGNYYWRNCGTAERRGMNQAAVERLNPELFADEGELMDRSAYPKKGIEVGDTINFHYGKSIVSRIEDTTCGKQYWRASMTHWKGECFMTGAQAKKLNPELFSKEREQPRPIAVGDWIRFKEGCYDEKVVSIEGEGRSSWYHSKTWQLPYHEAAKLNPDRFPPAEFPEYKPSQEEQEKAKNFNRAIAQSLAVPKELLQPGAAPAGAEVSIATSADGVSWDEIGNNGSPAKVGQAWDHSFDPPRLFELSKGIYKNVSDRVRTVGGKVVEPGYAINPVLAYERAGIVRQGPTVWESIGEHSFDVSAELRRQADARKKAAEAIADVDMMGCGCGLKVTQSGGDHYDWCPGLEGK